MKRHQMRFREIVQFSRHGITLFFVGVTYVNKHITPTDLDLKADERVNMLLAHPSAHPFDRHVAWPLPASVKKSEQNNCVAARQLFLFVSS